MEDVSIGANGVVNDQASAVDGAASKHDLMFKPASAWYGGLAATGTVSGNDLTLSGAGFTMKAQRSTLEQYQAAVAHLQSLAASDRQRLAIAQAEQAAQAARNQAAQAAQAAQNEAISDAADKTAKIQAATAQLRNDTAKMNAATAASPDFGRRSAMNTARIAEMMRIAPTLSDVNRNQLIVEANQVEVGTNQIEVARSQYVIGLNQIVQDAGPIADALERFCGSLQGAQFADPCSGGKAAAAEFRVSLARDRTSLIGYKQAVQDALNRQTAMIQRMGG
jgi:hypothetical protein